MKRESGGGCLQGSGETGDGADNGEDRDGELGLDAACGAGATAG